MLAVECDHVNIRYITGDMKSIGLKEYCLRHITGNYHVKEFYADKNITFSLEQGDMLGIIGSNGAGKSTLLKAISGALRGEFLVRAVFRGGDDRLRHRPPHPPPVPL